MNNYDDLKKMFITAVECMNYTDFSSMLYYANENFEKPINIDDVFISAIKSYTKKGDRLTYGDRNNLRKFISGIKEIKPTFTLQETLILLKNNLQKPLCNKLIRLTDNITADDYTENYEVLKPYFNVIKQTFKHVNTDSTKLLNEINKPDVLERINIKGSGCGPELTELSAKDFEQNVNHFSFSGIMSSKKAVKYLLNNPAHMKVFQNYFITLSYSNMYFYTARDPLISITKYVSDFDSVTKFLEPYSLADLTGSTLRLTNSQDTHRNTVYRFRINSWYSNHDVSVEKFNIVLKYVAPRIENKNERKAFEESIALLIKDDNYKNFSFIDNMKYDSDNPPSVYTILLSTEFVKKGLNL